MGIRARQEVQRPSPFQRLHSPLVLLKCEVTAAHPVSGRCAVIDPEGRSGNTHPVQLVTAGPGHRLLPRHPLHQVRQAQVCAHSVYGFVQVFAFVGLHMCLYACMCVVICMCFVCHVQTFVFNMWKYLCVMQMWVHVYVCVRIYLYVYVVLPV